MPIPKQHHPDSRATGYTKAQLDSDGFEESIIQGLTYMVKRTGRSIEVYEREETPLRGSYIKSNLLYTLSPDLSY